MATNMPPHNLVEVYEAIKLVMTKRRPKPTVEELMAVLPGPDLPSGGMIIDDGLAEAYATGRGTFRMRATAEIVNITKARQGIVVTELPYMVGPERIVSRIQELANTGKLVGVADVKKPPGPPHRHEHHDRVQGRDQRQGDPHRALPAHADGGVLRHQQRGPRRRCPHHRRPAGTCATSTPSTASTWYAAAPSTGSAGPATASTSSTACSSRSTRSTWSSRSSAPRRTPPKPGGASWTSCRSARSRRVHILDMQLRRLTALEKLKLQEEASALRDQIDDFEKLLDSEQRQRTHRAQGARRHGRPLRWTPPHPHHPPRPDR
jgi:hypothetical protein